MAYLKLVNLSKSYPDGWTLAGVSLDVEREEIVCLLGPSGCGKTTLLRLVAGLEPLDGGRVLVDGEDAAGLPPHRRGFGLMFQEYALFPHKNVFGNVAFGLQMQGLEREEVAARVAGALDLVGLAGFGRRDVNQLSGGERQRVALARSLAPRPRLLMLDEPLRALDRTLRERLMGELPAILHRAGVTAITVTHDQEEAFALADRIVLMRDGQVVQAATPEEIYSRPASAWAARFLGLTNLVEARVIAHGLVETGLGTLRTENTVGNWEPGARATLLIRPAPVRLEGGGPNVVRGVVSGRSFRGERYRLGVRCDGGIDLAFGFPTGADLPAPGEPVVLSLDAPALTLLPEDGESDE